jgi:hypothetical protein
MQPLHPAAAVLLLTCSRTTRVRSYHPYMCHLLYSIRIIMAVPVAGTEDGTDQARFGLGVDKSRYLRPSRTSIALCHGQSGRTSRAR